MAEQRSIREHLRRHWLFDLAQLAFAGVFIWLWRDIPVPGYAIGIVAAIAAAMSIHGDMRPWQKAVWMLLIGAFLIVEFRAIHKDRSDYATVEAVRRKEETLAFKSISDALTAVIQQNQMQFASTMSRFNENLNVMTGGNSYCYFTYNFGGTPALVHKGEYTLYDLHANFLNAKQNFIVGTEWLIGSPITVGDFSDGSARSITGVTKPSDLAGQLNLSIFFGARNGFWREEYHGQYTDGVWVEAIKVFKQHGAAFANDIVIFQKIDKRFPRDKNGKLLWN